MAGRQTEACERGQVPALQLRAADQVAAPGTRGGTGVHAPGRAGQGRFLPPQERGRAKLGCDTGWHAACTPYKSRWLQCVFSFFLFFFAAGQQVPALQPHAEHSAAPWPRAARALPGPAASPQFPLNGHADAGRGREPAARVQPCAAITVLLIPRGFRMSQPRAPCRGQLRRGELPSLPTWCARPGARCSSSPPGKAKFTLLSHGKNRPH